MHRMDKVTIASQIYANFQYIPTENQKKIIEHIALWLSDMGYGDFFVLNGYAGTGKTSIIASMVGACRKFGIRTVLLAPTGRAAKVMSMYSSCQAFTIHKQIYREKSRTEIISRFSLNRNAYSNTVFIVDEASMIPDGSSAEQAVFGSGRLLDDLVSYVRSGKNCRVMLVGDAAQLPPIGEELSPALDVNSMTDFGLVEYDEMDEVVRQESSSGILFNATMVRCMIENSIFERPKFNMNFPDFRRIDGQEVVDELESCYSRDGKDETILVTRSNKRAILFNESIRRRILSLEEELEAGDQLMVVKNNYFYAPEEDENKPLGFLANGDIATLKSFRKVEELYGFRFVNATLCFSDYDREVECKIILDTLHSNSPSLTREENERLFHAVEQDYMHIGDKRKRYREMREDPYLNAVQVKFAYAVTCHKSQGGQWRNVFVDRFVFGDELITKDLLRWLYTALTRSSDKVFLVGFDDGFFE